MSNLTRRAILRGSTAAAAAVAVSAIPAIATAADKGGASPTIAELFAEWRILREEVAADDRRSHEIYARMPQEFETGPGLPYPYPAAMPDDLQAARHAWHKANFPNDEELTNERSDAMAEIEHAIAETPGHSAADIAIKLWVHAHGLDIDYSSDITDAEAYAPADSLDECLIVSALRDAERLSGSVWKGGAS